MLTVGRVETRIYYVEGFRVAIEHLDGRNARSDRGGLPWYPYKRQARGSMSVAAWRQGRFQPKYPGFGVQVLDGHGRAAHGGTLLGTVRDSYVYP